MVAAGKDVEELMPPRLRPVEEVLVKLSERSKIVERQLEESRMENKGLLDKINSLEQKIDLLIYRK